MKFSKEVIKFCRLAESFLNRGLKENEYIAIIPTDGTLIKLGRHSSVLRLTYKEVSPCGISMNTIDLVGNKYYIETEEDEK